MKFKMTLTILAAAFALNAQAAPYSESAEDYVEARYGTHTPKEIYDTNMKAPDGSHIDVDVGDPPASHKFHRFQKFMGGHD